MRKCDVCGNLGDRSWGRTENEMENSPAEGGLIVVRGLLSGNAYFHSLKSFYLRVLFPSKVSVNIS